LSTTVSRHGQQEAKKRFKKLHDPSFPNRNPFVNERRAGRWVISGSWNGIVGAAEIGSLWRHGHDGLCPCPAPFHLADCTFILHDTVGLTPVGSVTLWFDITLIFQQYGASLMLISESQCGTDSQRETTHCCFRPRAHRRMTTY